MARRISLDVLCDLCEGDTEAEYLDIPAQVGQGSRLRTLDLCAQHYAELLQPVLEALERYGHDPNAPKPGSDMPLG